MIKRSSPEPGLGKGFHGTDGKEFQDAGQYKSAGWQGDAGFHP